MGLWDYLSSLLDSLWTSLGLKNKSGHLLLLGLDNAGKTTLLHRLRTGTVQAFPPTDRPSSEQFQYGRVHFQAWDLGGHEAVRHLWEDFVSEKVSVVLFLLDTADRQRLEEASYELDHLLHETDLLQEVPVCLLLNKCDLPEAMPTQEILDVLDFGAFTQNKENIQVFRISVLEGKGFEEAFRWISSLL